MNWFGAEAKVTAPENVDRRFSIINLAQDFSIETTPKQARKIASFADLLPAGAKVFIAYVPGEIHAEMVALTRRLREEGMAPVPHVPARSLASFAEFDAYVRALHNAGARHALVIAGGVDRPVGELTSSLELLGTGRFEELGFEGLFVAGHPEGNPDIPTAELARAIESKNLYAEHTGMPVTLTTQFAFDSEAILAWAERIGAAGNRLPIRIGVAGPASVTSLLKYARMCGVNASMQMLTKAGGKLFQLVGQAQPDGLITDLAAHRKGWAELIRHLHYYPFGGFERAAGWARSVARGAFTLHPDGEGFTLHG